MIEKKQLIPGTMVVDPETKNRFVYNGTRRRFAALLSLGKSIRHVEIPEVIVLQNYELGAIALEEE